MNNENNTNDNTVELVFTKEGKEYSVGKIDLDWDAEVIYSAIQSAFLAYSRI